MARSRVPPLLLALLLLLGTVSGGMTAAFPLEGEDGIPSTGWPGPIVGPARDGEPQVLWLRSGIFDPLNDRIPGMKGLDGTSSRGVYLVQFVGPLSPETGDRLSRAGLRVLGYVPEDGLVVEGRNPLDVLSLSRWSDVRWLSPWIDSWKVHPALEGASGTWLLTVLAWHEGVDLTRDLRATGARVLLHLLDEYIVEVDISRLPALAAVRGACWIEPWVAPDLMLDNAARSVGARQVDDGRFDPEGTAVWAFNKSMDTFGGTTGSSVTVDITDTGVDASHHAFAGRNDAYGAIEPGRPLWSDPLGHGTHVAGIVLGDGSYRLSEDASYHQNYDGKYAGVAPQARLAAQSLYGPGIVFAYKNLTRWSVQHDADISTNSWGTFASYVWSNYTVVSRDYDNATRDADWATPGNQSILVVFAAGNSGYNGSAVINYSLTPTASAKNVIAVGSVGNGKDPYSTPDELTLASSRGPTDDGRLKPDLVAPGDNVTSTWASEDGGSTGIKPEDSGAHSYINYGGTSMATPVVSGCAALVMDHLRSVEDYKTPSPAVVKSILIASADHLPNMEWPSMDQGWGRVNVSRAIVETRTLNTEWVDQSTKFTANGQSVEYRFEVQPGEPLRISLVWTDASSAVYTGKTLVNDLDLEARSPSGSVFKGNVFSSGQSTVGGSSDHTNNVEMVYLDAPEAGEWLVTVKAHELPPGGGDNQDFALAVVGNVNKKFVDLAAENLSVRATDKAEGDIIPIAFDLANLGNLPALNVAWRLVLLDGEGAVHETLLSGIDDIGPNSGKRITTEWMAIRGTWTVKAIPNPFRHITEESYQNNNNSKEFFIKGFGVDADIVTPSKAGFPGRDVAYKINVTNTGNVEDIILLSRTEPPPGWSARLDSTVMDIGSGKVRATNLIVSIPEGALINDQARVNVTITSQGNGSHSIELSTVTHVLAVYKVGLDLDKRSQEAVPGETVVFQFQMTNMGNDVDTYQVSHSQESGPTAGVSFDMPRSTFTVQAGGMVSGNLSVRLDPLAVGDLPVDEQITFNVRVVSVNDVTKGAIISGSVIIRQLHQVAIPVPSISEFNVLPGDDPSFIVEFLNQGNGGESVEPDMVLPDGWTWETDDAPVSLAVGQVKSILMWVSVPPSAEAGEYTTTMLAKVDGEVLAQHNLTFRVDWIPRLGVRLAQTGTAPDEFSISQGSEMALEFTITNEGNKEDTVTVEFGGLTRGLKATAQPQSVDIGVGNNARIVVVLNASVDAELLRKAYTITFVHADGVERQPYKVNVTVMYASNGGGNGPDDDDDDGGGLGSLPLIAAIIVIVLVVVVALFVMTNRRKQESKLEEAFFVTRSESATADVLQEELTSRERPPPPPPPPPTQDAEAAPSWGAETPPAAPAAAYQVETGPPAGGGSCPECGNAMQALSPPETGLYCPMCGHKTAK